MFTFKGSFMTNSPGQRIAQAVILCAAAWGGVAQAAEPTGVEPLRIGFVCPQTGGSADFGQSARHGAELAVKEINEVGGYRGRPLVLVTRDDRADPEVGRKAAEELITKEKVAFTVGFCNTGVALRALDLFQSHQHLLMVPVATGSPITQRDPAASSFVFRMSPRDSLQSAFLAQDVARRGLKKVAIFADRTRYGDSGLADLERELSRHRIALAHVVRFDLGANDLLADVQAAKAAGAEALVVYGVGPELAVLARARVAAKFSGPLMGPWTLSLRSVWERSGGAAEGALMVQSIVPDPSNERRISFMARMRRHLGGGTLGSLMAAAQTYDAIHLVTLALFQTRGDASGAALKGALENFQHSYSGVVTTYTRPFSPSDHDAFSANMIWLGTWRQGALTYAYPEDARRAAMVRRKE